MIIPRILGFVALATLIAASVFGRQALRANSGLRKVIGSLLFCAAAGTATSFTRVAFIIWPLAVAMLIAMVFLLWTIHIDDI